MSQIPTPSTQSLSTVCIHGLANRLRVLTSGMALAECLDRRFTMLWPLNSHCSAAFADLFTNEWPVCIVNEADIPPVTHFAPRRNQLFDATHPDLVVKHSNWLVDPGFTPQHAALFQRTVDFVRRLRPAPAIQREIDDFRSAYFHDRMIGVHLRRGDTLTLYKYSSNNTPDALAAVDAYLDAEPNAGVLLCSDDGAPQGSGTAAAALEGVHGKFRRRYGARVVWHTAKRLDRADPQAIRDAVVDLWLLRSTDYFVGTLHSSFSELAAVGRDVPKEIVDGHTRRYYRIVSALESIGVMAVLRAVYARRLGRSPTNAFVVNQLRHLFRR